MRYWNKRIFHLLSLHEDTLERVRVLIRTNTTVSLPGDVG